ncbi:MAG: NAD-dependent deacetylase [Calditrichaeota bacterium]|nr:NAD-dependent deacetylase [Calditrichota bacterium]
MILQEKFRKAKQAIKNADAVLIAAGAGMGVDSGLPDFRGNHGFWKAYPVAQKLGLSFTDMANPYWFRNDPRLAWAFYGHRLNLYRKTEPHDGFYQLLKFARTLAGGYFVFTSNVDGHFQKAGYDERRIVECHGSIHHLQCVEPCTNEIRSADEVEIEIDAETFRAKPPLPECPYCGNLARPNILMFNDWSWISHRTDEQEERLNNWLAQINREGYRLVIIEMGAGTAVPTVRYTSERVAQFTDGVLIRINPREYSTPEGHIGLACRAKEGIELLLGDLL